MSVLFDTIKRLYDEGKLTEVGVNNAVAKRWISTDEMYLIIPREDTPEEPEEEPADEPMEEPEPTQE